MLCAILAIQIDVLSDGAANMKKLFLSILLLCCCIVFTGCGGNSNSYDDAYRITVSKDIINDNLIESVRADVSAAREIKLCLNGVEFPGHSFDSENYIFTKVMYEQEASQIISSRNTSLIELFDGEILLATIEFDIAAPLPQNITVAKSGIYIIMTGSNGEIDVEYYTPRDGNPIEQEGLKKVKDIRLEKVDELIAKVTFYNSRGNTVHINFDSWKITAIKQNGDSVSWTSEQNKADSSPLLITPSVNGSAKYYTINLSSKGEDKVGSHTLANTSIRINEIKLNGKDVLSADVLSKAYLP